MAPNILLHLQEDEQAVRFVTKDGSVIEVEQGRPNEEYLYIEVYQAIGENYSDLVK